MTNTLYKASAAFNPNGTPAATYTTFAADVTGGLVATSRTSLTSFPCGGPTGDVTEAEGSTRGPLAPTMATTVSMCKAQQPLAPQQRSVAGVGPCRVTVLQPLWRCAVSCLCSYM